MTAFGIGSVAPIVAAAERLEAASKEIPERLEKETEEIAKEVAERAAQNALSLSSEGKGHTGLREKVSRGVGVHRVAGGSQVFTSMPDDADAAMPRALDSTTGWKHPVFGHSPFVVQHSSAPWFTNAVTEVGNTMDERLHKAVDEEL